jgi:hypothetical protein
MIITENYEFSPLTNMVLNFEDIPIIISKTGYGIEFCFEIEDKEYPKLEDIDPHTPWSKDIINSSLEEKEKIDIILFILYYLKTENLTLQPYNETITFLTDNKLDGNNYAICSI